MRRVSKAQYSFWGYALLLLLILYTLKGALYPAGIISKIIAFIELSICIFLGIKSFKFTHRNLVIDTLFIIIGIVTVSYIISDKEIYGSFIGYTTSFIYIRAFYGAVLPALGMYYLARTDKISLKQLEYFFYLIFIASIIAFFYETITVLIEKHHQITSNESYRFVYIMPFVVFLKGKTKILFLWILSIIVTILSAKRGAIVGVCLECLVYYWWMFCSSRNKFFFLLGILIICAIGGYYLYEYYQNDAYMQMRVEATLEGKTSGRDIIVSKLITHFVDADIGEIIFGAGFVQTLTIAGNYAHNDWLEFLIDIGLVGFSIYCVFYLSLLYTIKNTNDILRRGLWLIFIAFFPATFYSIVFFSESTSVGFLWLGYILGIRDKSNNMNRLSHSLAFVFNPKKK